MSLNWNYCQSNSEEILAEGLNYLRTADQGKACSISGNYLILHSGNHYYIGEAEDLSKRLKIQFSVNHSTFYKNYIEYHSALNENEPLTIKEFQILFIETKIGRKEMEEFGIVNLPTILNKFQKGKRLKREFAGANQLWHDIQNNHTDIFVQGEELLFNQNPIAWYKANIPKSPGVYRVLDVDKQLIYIGESSNINARYTTHGSDTYFSALRRHIATDILGFELIKKRKLTQENDDSVNDYLSQCTIDHMEVSFGRYEFEKYLIKKHLPILNRKDNK